MTSDAPVADLDSSRPVGAAPHRAGARPEGDRRFRGARRDDRTGPGARALGRATSAADRGRARRRRDPAVEAAEVVMLEETRASRSPTGPRPDAPEEQLTPEVVTRSTGTTPTGPLVVGRPDRAQRADAGRERWSAGDLATRPTSRTSSRRRHPRRRSVPTSALAGRSTAYDT